MDNPKIILLNEDLPSTSDPGIVYPAWISEDGLHQWALITSSKPPNAVLRLILTRLGCRDINSNDTWSAFLCPFTEPFPGGDYLSDLPEFGTPPAISDLDAWLLPPGTKVTRDFDHSTRSTPTEFEIITLKESALFRLGSVGQAPEINFVWNYGLKLPLILGDKELSLPDDLFNLNFRGRWGTELYWHDFKIGAGVSDRIGDSASGRTLLKLPHDKLRLEFRQSEPLEFSYFGSGVCQLSLDMASINLGFNESGDLSESVGVYLHEPDQRKWFNFRVKTPPITIDTTTLPSLVMPTQSEAAPPIPDSSLSYEIKLGWGSINGHDFVDPPKVLLTFSGQDTGEAIRGGLEINRDIFTAAQSVIDLKSQLSRFAGSDLDFSSLIPGFQGLATFLTPLSVSRIPLKMSGEYFQLPIGLSLEGLGVGGLKVVLVLEVHCQTLRLNVTQRRMYFYLQADPETANCVLDLESVAIGLPVGEFSLEKILNNPDHEKNADGFIDPLSNQFVLMKGQRTEHPWVMFPGNLKSDEIGESESLQKRILLKQVPVDFDKLGCPDHPLNALDGEVVMAIGRSGITFHAELEIEQSITVLSEPGVENVELRARKKSTEVDVDKSEMAWIDSRIVKAKLAFDLDLPGFRDTSVAGALELRQSKRGAAPEVVASFDIKQTDAPKEGDLTMGALSAQLTRIRPKLTWDNGKWSLSIPAWGWFSIASGVDGSAAGTFKQEAKLTFEALDLTNLHQGGKITISLAKRDPAVQFSLLGGKLRCRMGELALSWELGKNNLEIDCRDVSFDVGAESGLQVGFDTGRLTLSLDNQRKLSAAFKESITLRVAMQPSFAFVGQATYRKPSSSLPYGELKARGSINVGGLDVTVLLAISVIRKTGGSLQLAVVVGGGWVINQQLAPVLNVYSFLVGLAVNYRLQGIGANPDAKQLVKKIDQLEPENMDNWTLVWEDGTYVAVFGKLWLTPTVTSATVSNAYTASLLACVDSKLRFLGAGKLWIASSVSYAQTHTSNPLLVGGISFLPREKELRIYLETRPNPAIEANPQLAKILEGAEGYLDFRVNNRLADYQVQVTYRQKFFDVEMEFKGGFRVAVFDSAVFARAWLKITGQYKKTFQEGARGIEFNADFYTDADFRQLIETRGIVAYAKIDQRLSVSVSAWMEIQVIKWVEERVKKLLEWITRRKQEISFSKISGSMGATIKFLGTAGIRPGGIGFQGKVSVSGNLCGHDFSLGVDFEISPDVVKSALEKLSAFERRLDEAIPDRSQRALSPVPEFSLSGATPFLENIIVTPEKWTLSQEIVGNELRIMAVPMQAGLWYLPEVDESFTGNDLNQLPVKNYVSKIQFLDAEDKVVHELQPYWHWYQFKKELPVDSAELRAVKEAEVAFLQTVGGTRLMQQEDVLRDPRLESRDRSYWTKSDRLSFPDYAAPARLAPIEELLEDPNLSAIDEILRFAKIRNEAEEVQLLASDEGNELQQLHKARGQLIFALNDEFQGTAVSNRFQSVELSASSESTRELGLIAHLPNDGNVTRVQIFRKADSSSGDSVVATLDVEQRGDVKIADAGKKSGFRALPWGLDFVSVENQQKRLGIEGSVVVELPLYIPDEWVKLNRVGSKTLGGIDVYRQLPNEDPQLILRRKVPHTDRFYSRDNLRNEERLYSIPEPVICNDVFPYDSQGLIDRRIELDRTPVRYFFEAYDSQGVLLGNGEWLPVRLFKPSPVKLPERLVFVFAIEEMTQKTQQLNTVLCSMDDGVAQTVAVTADQIEVYITEKQIPISGFFTGDEFQSAAENPTAYLDDVYAGMQAESVTTKNRLTSFDEQEPPGRFLIQRSAIDPRISYQFFVRFTTRNDDVLGMPVAIGFVNTIDELKSPDKVQILKQFEWPDLPVTQEELGGEIQTEFLNRSQFSIDEALVHHDRWMRIEMNDLPESGGAEVILIDQQDPNLILRKRVEYYERKVFQISERDLSVASRWQLTDANHDEAPHVIEAFSEAAYDREVWQYYIDEAVLKERYLVKRLDPKEAGSPAKSLVDVLGVGSDRSFESIYRHSVLYLAAWTEFLRSPLNCGVESIREVRDALSDILIGMMVGVRISSPSDIQINAVVQLIRQRLNEFQQLYLKLRSEEYASLISFGEDDPNTVRILDALGLARPASSIIKTRWNYGLKMLVTRTTKIPVSIDIEGKRLIDSERFEELLRLRESPDYWPEDIIPDPETQVANRILNEDLFEAEGESAAAYVRRFIGIIYDLLIDESYQESLAERVVRASGISQLLDDLQDAAPEWTFVTRPHHQARIVHAESGEASILETELSLFRPDYLFEEGLPSAGNPFEWHSDEQLIKGVATLFHFFERMGFSVDIGANDGVKNPVEQSDLLAVLPQAEEHHSRFVCQPIASYNYNPFPEQASLGYDFISVAVVPDQFLQALKEFYASASQNRTVPRISESLKDWLEIRNIEHADTLENRRVLLALAELVVRLLPLGRHSSTTLTPSSLFVVDQRHVSPMPLPVDKSAVLFMPAPDVWGRDFKVLVAPLSRYEPWFQLRDRTRCVSIPWDDLDKLAHPFRLRSNVCLVEDHSKEDRSSGTLTTVQAIEDALTPLVSAIPHPTRIQFLFRPSDFGQRSSVNKMVKTRTGHEGTDLRFSFRPLDFDLENPLCWSRVLDEIRQVDEAPANHSSWSVPYPGGSELLPGALDAEQLVCLEHLPHCFDYELIVTENFRQAPYVSPFPRSREVLTRRRPSRLSMHQPRLQVNDAGADRWEWTFTFVLSRHKDHLTMLETANTPPDLAETLLAPLNTEPTTFEPQPITRLPDLEMGFQLFYEYPPDDAGTKAMEKTFIAGAIVVLPWHPAYQQHEKPVPLIQSLRSDFEIRRASENGLLYQPIDCHRPEGKDPWFSLSFKVLVPKDLKYFQYTDKFRWRAIRSDFEAQALLPFQKQET